MQRKPGILIYIVDDDASVRKALELLFLSVDMEVRTFERGEDLLKEPIREERACLVAGMKMKGLSGLELQQELTNRGIRMPVIFLTALDSDATRKLAKQAGALGYLKKPVDDQALLDSIRWAMSS